MAHSDLEGDPTNVRVAPGPLGGARRLHVLALCTLVGVSQNPQILGEPQAFAAVDHVPVWAGSLGAMTVAFTAIWIPFREHMPGSGPLLVLFLVLASLGVTFGTCGVLLAMRDGRRLGLAVAGLCANLSLPTILLVAGS